MQTERVNSPALIMHIVSRLVIALEMRRDSFRRDYKSRPSMQPTPGVSGFGRLLSNDSYLPKSRNILTNNPQTDPRRRHERRPR